MGSKTHQRWLHWKMERGLTYRGRMPEKLTPRGAFARFLHAVYFKKAHARAYARATALGLISRPPKVFHQHVGGVVGLEGKTNGE